MNDYFKYAQVKAQGDQIIFFFNCTLKKKLGHYEEGERFERIEVDYDSQEMTCYQQGEVVLQRNFSIVVDDD